ncbi:MAG: hypothetical protein JWP30_1156, partial [Homoserinimonas sp.]|nr:hypothetical protein [Homoserinimonas sp.]
MRIIFYMLAGGISAVVTFVLAIVIYKLSNKY